MARIVPFERGLEEAIEVLGSAGVVAHPTDTVYGLGADPWNPEAVEKVRRIKGRAEGKGFILVASDLGMVEGLVEDVPEEFHVLAEMFWPGPLTLVLKAGPEAPPWCEGTVAVRVPGHEGLRRLIASFGRAVISTSANSSGGKPAETAQEVARLEGVDLILDGGRCSGPPSTILDLSSGRPSILRRGRMYERTLEIIRRRC